MPTRASPKPVISDLPDLTIAQVCTALNIVRSMADKLVRSMADKLVRNGSLTAYKLGDTPRSGVRVTRESVEALRAARRTKPLSAQGPAVYQEGGAA